MTSLPAPESIQDRARRIGHFLRMQREPDPVVATYRQYEDGEGLKVDALRALWRRDRRLVERRLLDDASRLVEGALLESRRVLAEVSDRLRPFRKDLGMKATYLHETHVLRGRRSLPRQGGASTVVGWSGLKSPKSRRVFDQYPILLVLPHVYPRGGVPRDGMEVLTACREHLRRQVTNLASEFREPSRVPWDQYGPLLAHAFDIAPWSQGVDPRVLAWVSPETRPDRVDSLATVLSLGLIAAALAGAPVSAGVALAAAITEAVVDSRSFLKALEQDDRSARINLALETITGGAGIRSTGNIRAVAMQVIGLRILGAAASKAVGRAPRGRERGAAEGGETLPPSGGSSDSPSARSLERPSSGRPGAGSRMTRPEHRSTGPEAGGIDAETPGVLRARGGGVSPAEPALRFEGRTVLVDENLSPTLVPILRSQGFNAERVVLEEADAIIAKQAARDGSIVLTNNLRDIEKVSGFKRDELVVIGVESGLSSRAARVELTRQLLNLSERAALNPSVLSPGKPIILKP